MFEHKVADISSELLTTTVFAGSALSQLIFIYQLVEGAHEVIPIWLISSELASSQHEKVVADISEDLTTTGKSSSTLPFNLILQGGKCALCTNPVLLDVERG